MCVQDDDCVYTIYAQTGWGIGSGTDSIIGLKLYDTNGSLVDIENLVAWGGLMGPDHDYFESGNLDIFSGRGRCLDEPVCAINVTSDGSGILPGWYCEYVQVTSIGPQIPCAQQNFKIEQWIAPEIYPFKLWAYRNNCKYDLGKARFRPAAHHDAKLEPRFSILDSAVHS